MSQLPPVAPSSLPPAVPQLQTRYAGFWVRFVGYLIDAILLGILSAILGRATGVSLILSLIYFIGMWTWQGATLGQMALGMKVVRADNGQPIDASKAVMRYIGMIVASIPLGLGLIWVGFDARKQGWHDKIAQTVVLRQA